MLRNALTFSLVTAFRKCHCSAKFSSPGNTQQAVNWWLPIPCLLCIAEFKNCPLHHGSPCTIQTSCTLHRPSLMAFPLPSYLWVCQSEAKVTVKSTLLPTSTASLRQKGFPKHQSKLELLRTKAPRPGGRHLSRKAGACCPAH